MVQNQIKPNKILVKRNAALGDVLLATSVLPILRKRYPDHHIDFETSCPEILSNYQLIDNTLKTGIPSDDDYELIFDLNNTYEKKPNLSIFESFAEIIKCDVDELELCFNCSEEQRIIADNILIKNNVTTDRFVAIQSGASYWLKTMDPEYLEMLINKFKNQFSISFVLLGSLKDPLLKGAVDLRGKCSFLESAAIIHKCIAFIGHDSALIHVAKAMKIPVVAFFGHTDPSKRININEEDCIFISKMQCRFCYHRRKPPVIISFCKKQSHFWQILDIVLQFGLHYLTKKNNYYSRLIINKIYSFQDKLRNGKKVALCMRNIEKQDILTQLYTWLVTLMALKN